MRCATAAVASLAVSSAVACGAAHNAQRQLHTPPGGFDEALPPSFGRHTGKGELSNVNLRAKQQRARLARRSRRKLHRPSEASAAAAMPTLAQVRRELHALIGQTRETRGESASRVAALRGIEVREEVIGAFAEVERRRGLPADVAATVRQEEKGEQTLSLPFPTTSEDLMGAGVAPWSEAAPSLAERRAASSTSPETALEPLLEAKEEEWVSQEDAVERAYAVQPSSTIFGSDLDRLERDMLREFHQRGKDLPRPDRIYAEFGSGRRAARMQWNSSSSFDHLRCSDFAANDAAEHGLGDKMNRNLSPYHLYAEAYRTQQEERLRGLRGGGSGGGVNLCHSGTGNDTGKDAAAHADLPASVNPHFPEEAEEVGGAQKTRDRPGAATEDEPHKTERERTTLATEKEIVIDARTDYKPRLTTVLTAPGGAEDANRIVYDAYHQRPATNQLPEVRGADYWSDQENRRRVEERAAHRAEAFTREVLLEGAMDSSEVEYSTNKVRKETLLYFQAHPINEMIQEPFVRIRHLLLPGGGTQISFNPNEPLTLPADAGDESRPLVETVNMDADIPVQEARRMAQELGLDLIRVGAHYSQKTDRRIIALCMIGDHREHMRDMIKFKIQKLGVQPPPTKQCIEVPFTGGTHPHAIRFKCVGIAKHILHRHAIRINLTKFGTPREGFPVLQCILDELKRQCLQLKAYHTAGEIRATYNEIFCYLYPSTGRSPKTTVTHPTPAQVAEAMQDSQLETEKEIYFDDLHSKVTQKQRLQYLLKLQNGTAWAEKDEGMSLKRQRAIKVMLGYIPKGNKELYAARGDVNIPAPFRASHPTSVDRWSHPAESNLDQASRGAAALGKRARMPISEMHDRGETPENPTQLDRFYYTAEGPALELGEFKEALGLKDNRTRRPPAGPGFAALGTKTPEREVATPGFASK